MKFLIVDTYYKGFLDNFWNENESLKKKGYKEIKKKLLDACFGTSDFYSYNLEKNGHEAVDLIVNDEILQRKWADENKLEVRNSGFFSKLQSLPVIHKFIGRPNWIQTIALEQIKKEKPDIVYMQDLSILNPNTLKKVKKYCKLLVGQIACPLPAVDNLKQFDLIITSFPHYVERFKKLGVNSEYLPLAFENRILQKFKNVKKKYDISFVGGISPSHIKGLKMLNFLANRIKISVWGYGKNILPRSSKLYHSHNGEAWALDMYQKLAESKITVNRHIDVSENYANNMRLFEATGMGTMLITDKKKNLNKLFKVGKEVVDYNDNEDLLNKIKYYLKHEDIRKKIAKLGQYRTLNYHGYSTRMKQLTKIITKYIK